MALMPLNCCRLNSAHPISTPLLPSSSPMLTGASEAAPPSTSGRQPSMRVESFRTVSKL